MQINTFFCCAKSMLKKQRKEDAKECRGKHAVMLDTTADVEMLRHVPIILYSTLHVVMEGLNETLQLRWACPSGESVLMVIYYLIG
jgi:hypothetical protein